MYKIYPCNKKSNINLSYFLSPIIYHLTLIRKYINQLRINSRANNISIDLFLFIILIPPNNYKLKWIILSMKEIFFSVIKFVLINVLVSLILKIQVLKKLCIPKRFNTNNSPQLFDYIVTFVNSRESLEHKFKKLILFSKPVLKMYGTQN